MNILVLVKAVPLVGEERLDDRMRTQRGHLELNGADEYLLERALRLTEATEGGAAGGEVSVLSMGPAPAADALRKALAMGATRAYHVVDDALAGSDIRATITVLEAAVRRVAFDLLLCGADTSDGQAGIVGAALASRLGMPYLSYASEIDLPGDGHVRVRRLSPSGYDVLEATGPAVVMGTQLLGEPRYPSLRGIMAARSKETVTWSLADLGLDPDAVGEVAATTRVQSAVPPAQRASAVIVQQPPEEAVARVVSLLAERGLL
ncbi:electron transfer flavoprotein subunit beta/FixA family protein [soil metagenome]